MSCPEKNAHEEIFIRYYNGNIHKLPPFLNSPLTFQINSFSMHENIAYMLWLKSGRKLLLLAVLLFSPFYLFAAGGEVPSIGPVRVEFIIFGFILLGVALFHKQTFWVAVIGLSVLLTFKLIFDPGFHLFEHFFGTTPIGRTDYG